MTMELSILYSFVIFFLGITWHVVTLSFFFSNEVIGILEGFNETSVSSLIELCSLGFSLSCSLALLSFNGLLSVDLSLFFLSEHKLSLLSGEWVDFEHHCFVGQWVLLGLVVDSNVLSNCSKL